MEENKKVVLQRGHTELQAETAGMPLSIVEPALVAYRSAGIGLFGVVMRYAGMPLEKIALYMNSSQVSGQNQFAQSLKLTFREGVLAPYRVVGVPSVVAWFLQYSVMGLAFQFFDHALSKMMGVRPVYYGTELMQPPEERPESLNYQIKSSVKTILSPIFTAALESMVSNRAEVQRFFGIKKFAHVEERLNLNLVARASGPAFLPSCTRNLIMCQTTFLLTPITYKLYFPQEHKSMSSLFWYGLGVNVFIGNGIAITQQALWGRTLDYAAANGEINYRNIVKQGLAKEGFSAFWTAPKWFSRVLMNAPAQGVLPWFYNEILPFGESAYLNAIKNAIYIPSAKGGSRATPQSATSDKLSGSFRSTTRTQ